MKQVRARPVMARAPQRPVRCAVLVGCPVSIRDICLVAIGRGGTVRQASNSASVRRVIAEQSHKEIKLRVSCFSLSTLGLVLLSCPLCSHAGSAWSPADPPGLPDRSAL
jgi:hypothetical protein